MGGDDTLTCVCDSGFTGDRCQDNINECTAAEKPCSDHGVCTDSIGAYSCDCTGGWSGDKCELCNGPGGDDRVEDTRQCTDVTAAQCAAFPALLTLCPIGCHVCVASTTMTTTTTSVRSTCEQDLRSDHSCSSVEDCGCGNECDELFCTVPGTTTTTTTATTTTTPLLFDNGAGGSYSMSFASPTNAQHALSACESYAGVGKCETGDCGDFFYYYVISDGDCKNSKTGYEWIYRNDGYATVGQDYWDGSESVAGNSLFVRQKISSSRAWSLVLKDLGVADKVTTTTTTTTSTTTTATATTTTLPSLAGFVTSEDDLSTLLAAVEAAGLVDALSATYVKQTDLCDERGMDFTFASCKAAATSLDLNFADTAGPEWHTGCLFHNGGVYFSEHEDGSNQDTTDGYICAQAFTVFAPNNDAFAKVPADALAALFADPGQLKQVIMYHVLASQVLSTELKVGEQKVDTASGGALWVTKGTSGVTVANSDKSIVANVIAVDNMADNGVAHLIDGVLLPPATSTPTTTTTTTTATTTTEPSTLSATSSLADSVSLEQLMSDLAITCSAEVDNCTNSEACVAFLESTMSGLEPSIEDAKAAGEAAVAIWTCATGSASGFPSGVGLPTSTAASTTSINVPPTTPEKKDRTVATTSTVNTSDTNGPNGNSSALDASLGEDDAGADDLGGGSSAGLVGGGCCSCARCSCCYCILCKAGAEFESECSNDRPPTVVGGSQPSIYRQWCCCWPPGYRDPSTAWVRNCYPVRTSSSFSSA